MSFGPPRDGQHTFQRLDPNPTVDGHPRPRRRGSARHHGVPPHLRAGDVRPRPLLARRRPERRPQTAQRLVLRTRRPAGRGRRRGHHGLRRARGRRRPAAALPSEAVRLLPGHDQWVIGPGTKDVHVTPPSRRDPVTRKANPVIVGGVVCGTWARKGDELTVTWLDERRRPDERNRAGGRATGRHPRPRPAPEADLIADRRGRPPPASRQIEGDRTKATGSLGKSVQESEEVVPVNVSTWVLPSGATVRR